MQISEYINKNYNGSKDWFVDEVQQSWNLNRISNVINNKYYLSGVHKVLNREDITFKGQTYHVRKLILQQMKTILNFHSTYLMGTPLSLTGTEEKVKEYKRIYRSGAYDDTDYNIVDKVGKYGDVYEYVYVDNNRIKSKLINPEDGYPVLSENNEYIGFIDHYTVNNISYYTVYTNDRVEEYNNDGGDIEKTGEYMNVSGLPIHYHSVNDLDDNYGKSLIDDIKPILDELEDLLSKMGDSIYTLSLNPLLITEGQRVDATVPADAVGYSIALENGADMRYVSAQMDYNTIKLYLETLQRELSNIAYMPSVALGNSNVANVSEVSLKLLYQLADVYAMLSEKWFRRGLMQRFEYFDKILSLQGKQFTEDEYVDVEFNYSRPVNSSETLDNIKKQWEMGAISMQSIIEKSPLTNDVVSELARIQSDNKVKENNEGNNVTDNAENKDNDNE